jgi:hypothetical protein
MTQKNTNHGNGKHNRPSVITRLVKRHDAGKHKDKENVGTVCPLCAPKGLAL